MILGARGCTKCGTPANNAIIQDQAVNRVEYEQKGDSKKMTAIFTNSIGEQLVHSFQGLFGVPNSKGILNGNPFSSNKGALLTNRSGKTTQGKPDVFEDAELIDQVSDASINESLPEIFRPDGEKLVLINSRLKQRGKRDKGIRIALLGIYAYSLTEKKQVNRNMINEILDHAKVNDGNFRKWFSNCDEITKLDDGYLELSMPGINAVKAILSEFSDSTIEKGSVEFSHLSGKVKHKKVATRALTKDTNKKVPGTMSKSLGKASPLNLINQLIQESFFSKKRKIGEVVQHLKDNKATSISNGTAATVLARLIKSNKLKREKNGEAQYEYYQ